MSNLHLEALQAYKFVNYYTDLFFGCSTGRLCHDIKNFFSIFCLKPFGILQITPFAIDLTEVAGEGGPNLAPQNFLLSQKFRHLMRCKKYLEIFFLSCLVFEKQLFVYIFGRNSKWLPEVQKGSPVKFFEVSYSQTFFLALYSS